MTASLSASFYVRTFVLVAVLLAARQAVSGRSSVETPLPRPLAAFPLELERWRGVDGPAFAPEIARTLGADEYINRVYHDGAAAVGLYVAHYARQRRGDAIHSPQHCLPGTGWEPVSRGRVTIDAGSEQLAVNRYVVQKRAQRQLVLYWFQGRGRTTASEYANKLHLLSDALLRGRTDGALVRLIAPIDGPDRLAEASAVRFLRAAQPQLSRWLP